MPSASLLVPRADNEFLGGDDRNRDVIERIDKRRGGHYPPRHVNDHIRVDQVPRYDGSRQP
jgi:hypothetical protein